MGRDPLFKLSRGTLAYRGSCPSFPEVVSISRSSVRVGISSKAADGRTPGFQRTERVLVSQC